MESKIIMNNRSSSMGNLVPHKNDPQVNIKQPASRNLKVNMESNGEIFNSHNYLNKLKQTNSLHHRSPLTSSSQNQLIQSKRSLISQPHQNQYHSTDSSKNITFLKPEMPNLSSHEMIKSVDQLKVKITAFQVQNTENISLEAEKNDRILAPHQTQQLNQLSREEPKRFQMRQQYKSREIPQELSQIRGGNKSREISQELSQIRGGNKSREISQELRQIRGGSQQQMKNSHNLTSQMSTPQRSRNISQLSSKNVKQSQLLHEIVTPGSNLSNLQNSYTNHPLSSINIVDSLRSSLILKPFVSQRGLAKDPPPRSGQHINQESAQCYHRGLAQDSYVSDSVFDCHHAPEILKNQDNHRVSIVLNPPKKNIHPFSRVLNNSSLRERITEKMNEISNSLNRKEDKSELFVKPSDSQNGLGVKYQVSKRGLGHKLPLSVQKVMEMPLEKLEKVELIFKHGLRNRNINGPSISMRESDLYNLFRRLWDKQEMFYKQPQESESRYLLQGVQLEESVVQKISEIVEVLKQIDVIKLLDQKSSNQKCARIFIGFMEGFPHLQFIFFEKLSAVKQANSMLTQTSDKEVVPYYLGNSLSSVQLKDRLFHHNFRKFFTPFDFHLLIEQVIKPDLDMLKNRASAFIHKFYSSTLTTIANTVKQTVKNIFEIEQEQSIAKQIIPQEIQKIFDITTFTRKSSVLTFKQSSIHQYPAQYNLSHFIDSLTQDLSSDLKKYIVKSPFPPEKI